MKSPNPKFHLIMSLAKSGIRILFAAQALREISRNLPVTGLGYLAGGIIIAELIGILEELI